MARCRSRHNKRTVNKTVLIIGEGVIDKAFIKYMNTLYGDRRNGQTVKIDSGDGGSPRDVIKKAISYRHAEFDFKYVLLDSDVEIQESVRRYATKNRVEILVSTPICLEGMLLEISDKKIGSDNNECKSLLDNIVSGKTIYPNSYSLAFPKNLLDGCKHETIKMLIKVLSNN